MGFQIKFELHTKIILKIFYIFKKVIIEEDIVYRGSKSFPEESGWCVYSSWSLGRNPSLPGKDVDGTHHVSLYNWTPPRLISYSAATTTLAYILVLTAACHPIPLSLSTLTLFQSSSCVCMFNVPVNCEFFSNSLGK